jgi:hypothetical protein
MHEDTASETTPKEGSAYWQHGTRVLSSLLIGESRLDVAGLPREVCAPACLGCRHASWALQLTMQMVAAVNTTAITPANSMCARWGIAKQPARMDFGG